LESIYRGTSSAINAEVATHISDGLITAVFPAASAGASGPKVSISGSFHAPMIKVTPSGSRRTLTCPGSSSSGVGSRSAFTQ
jgi:hypothetical protein